MTTTTIEIEYARNLLNMEWHTHRIEFGVYSTLMKACDTLESELTNPVADDLMALADSLGPDFVKDDSVDAGSEAPGGPSEGHHPGPSVAGFSSEGSRRTFWGRK